VLPRSVGSRAGAPPGRQLADLVLELWPDRLASAAVMALLLCGAVLWLFGLVVIWALCHVGSRGDRQLENLNSDEVFQDG